MHHLCVGMVMWTSPEGAPETPLTHQAKEELWNSATTAVGPVVSGPFPKVPRVQPQLEGGA